MLIIKKERKELVLHAHIEQKEIGVSIEDKYFRKFQFIYVNEKDIDELIDYLKEAKKKMEEVK